MARKLKDAVIVITGASSGIGRITAMKLAQQGARVLAVARRLEALEELRDQCRNAPGLILPIGADVTSEAALQEVAEVALENFGRLDAWVNNAAVSLFAPFEEAPSQVYRQVLETNLFGYIHGARAAIPIFREQGTGTLVNVSSMVARSGSPFISAYVTSKAAINGLTLSLRQELRDTEIKVCLVMPASIDTPLFQQAANFTGRAIQPLDPIYDPEIVSDQILRVLKRPTAEVYAGNAGRFLGGLRRIAPRTVERFTARQVEKDHFQDRSAPPSTGNLFRPLPNLARVDGGWNGKSRLLRRPLPRLALTGALLAIPTALMLLSSPAPPSRSWLQQLLPG